MLFAKYKKFFVLKTVFMSLALIFLVINIFSQKNNFLTEKSDVVFLINLNNLENIKHNYNDKLLEIVNSRPNRQFGLFLYNDQKKYNYYLPATSDHNLFEVYLKSINQNIVLTGSQDVFGSFVKNSKNDTLGINVIDKNIFGTENISSDLTILNNAQLNRKGFAVISFAIIFILFGL